MATLTEEKRWVTINGSAVQIDGDGTVISGPKALRGKKLGKGKPGGGKPTNSDDNPPATKKAKSKDPSKYLSDRQGKLSKTEAEKQALGKYVLGGYREINDSLRKGKTPKEAKYIDAIMSRQEPLDQEISVVRGLKSTDFMGDVKPGGTYTEKGYMSTTPKASVAKQYAKASLTAGNSGEPAVLQITVPKGARGIYFRAHDEFTLPRNTTLKFTSVKTTGGIRYISAEVVLSKAKRESYLRESYHSLDSLRNRAETDFASALAQLDSDHREILRDALERYGRVQDIPEHIWRGIQFDIEERAAAVILAIIILGDDWTTSAIEDQGGRQRRLTLPQQASYAAAATIQASDMAAAATDSLRRRLARSVEDMRISGPGNIGNLTPSGIEKALDEVLNDQRRETLAIDQTTQGLSYGQMGARDRAGDGASTAGQATSIELYWVTERDDRVCERCSPLHDKPESVWGLVFPEGPGPAAHPNCRCSLRPVVVVQSQDAAT